MIYTDIISDLNNYQLTKICSDDDIYPINVPTFVYGKYIESDYVLVVEDLLPSGYFSPEKTEELNLEQVLVVVGGLAKLHGVSYAYSKSHGHLIEKYPAF